MQRQLRTFQYTGESPGRRLLITGAVHGDEFEPIAAVRRLIDLFENRDPQVATFAGHLTLVPIVNESAFLRGHRCGSDGMDLARTCPGREDGSETEQTAWLLSQLIRQADYYIDLHTGGTEAAVYPLAGYSLHRNPDVLNVQRRMARAFNLPVIWGTTPDLQGRSLSVARDANVPAIYCEYLGSAACSPLGVEAYTEGCLSVMAELGMLRRNSPASLIRYLVEDDTPNSGHMQVCNPSPVTGYFDPAVRLGDLVRRGDLLGTVVSMDGTKTRVTADQNGLVIMLRTFPRISEGQSLCVVMDTDKHLPA